MTEAGLNLIGLMLNVIGGLVIFKWGPPQPSFERHTLLSIGEDPVRAAEVAALERRHYVMSRVGLALIIVGFVLQLPAAVRPLTVL
jgi:hypothetical protein